MELNSIRAGDLQLRGRVILVTGAARGLGRAYVECLARAGATLVVHDAGLSLDGESADGRLAEYTAAELCRTGGSASSAAHLLVDSTACRELVELVLARYGRIDALIHNAGLVIWRDPADVDGIIYNRSSSINSEAAFWLVNAALPTMRKQGFGRIVLTTSGWALAPSRGSDELVLYSHGKAAQFGMGMALAYGAGHPGILTNVIAPVANTRVFRGKVSKDQLRPEAVAGSVAWLVSPVCDINGCLFRICDGEIALVRVCDIAKVNLGAQAEDPVTAGAALRDLVLKNSP